MLNRRHTLCSVLRTSSRTFRVEIPSLRGAYPSEELQSNAATVCSLLQQGICCKVSKLTGSVYHRLLPRMSLFTSTLCYLEAKAGFWLVNPQNLSFVVLYSASQLCGHLCRSNSPPPVPPLAGSAANSSWCKCREAHTHMHTHKTIISRFKKETKV